MENGRKASCIASEKKLALLSYICWQLNRDIKYFSFIWKKMKLILESLRSSGYHVTGKAFAIELLGNIILIILNIKSEHSIYPIWKDFPFSDYAVINKRLKK